MRAMSPAPVVTNLGGWVVMGATVPLRETIRKRLASDAGDVGDTLSIANSTLALWENVAQQLAPVIGHRGVDVLFSRALHLTSKGFPWLARPGPPGATPVETFKAHLQANEASVSSEAGCAVLVTVVDLLGTLIGAPLSERLLAQVWVPPAEAGQERRP